MEEIQKEMYEEDEEVDTIKMQRLLERTLERKKQREERLKQKIENEKAAMLIMEKLRNEKKEQEYNRARQCYYMANQARTFITNVKDTQAIYKIQNEWLVQYMQILKESQNGPSNTTHTKYNQFSNLMPHLRYIPFIKMDPGSVKQVATILFNFGTFQNSVYWASLPQHIITFNIPFTKPEGLEEYEDDDDDEDVSNEMGFPYIPDYVVYSLFPTFLSVWRPHDHNSQKVNEAYMAILHSMLSIDTFTDYVKEQFDLHRKDVFYAKTNAEKKKAEKMHHVRMEFASKLAFFPSSRIMFIRGYLTDVLRNCGNVPFACRFMMDIIRHTQKFIMTIEKNPRLTVKSDGDKHYFSLTKNLSREVAEFKRIAKQVDSHCKNELKIFEELLHK